MSQYTELGPFFCNGCEKNFNSNAEHYKETMIYASADNMEPMKLVDPPEEVGFIEQIKELKIIAEAKVLSAMPKFTNKASDLLYEGAKTVEERHKTHGPPKKNLQDIADLWTTFLNITFGIKIKVEAWHVSAMMILLKMARRISSKNLDHWVDMAGYSGCGAEVDE